MTNNKQKLEEARRKLLEVTKLLNDILENGGDENTDVEDWLKDRIELWCRIYNEGGVVTKERLHQIWRDEMKKDPRGLGGFFVGNHASLKRIAGDKIALTEDAEEAIESWTGKSIEEYTKRFKKE